MGTETGQVGGGCMQVDVYRQASRCDLEHTGNSDPVPGLWSLIPETLRMNKEYDPERKIIPPTDTPLHCGRKLENPEETCADTGGDVRELAEMEPPPFFYTKCAPVTSL